VRTGAVEIGSELYKLLRFSHAGPNSKSSSTLNRTTRSFATATPKSSYKEKTTSDVWLSDTGVRKLSSTLPCTSSFPRRVFIQRILLFFLSPRQAYPVMGVIIVGILFPAGYGIWVMAKHPDARISKGSRKSTFRGELKGTPQE
jgi:hypothetical protein